MDLKWLDSLRVRLILLICLSSIPPLVVVIYNAVYEGERIESDALENAYKLAQLASQYQGGLVEGTQELLVGISHTPAVIAGDWARCEHYLTNVLGKNTRYSNLGVANLKGDILCSGEPMTRKLNVRDRQYFIRALASGSFAVGDYHVGRVTGIPSLGMALPVYEADGRIVAIAYAAINLETLKQTVDEIELPTDGILFMFDRNGKLLVQSRQQGSHWVADHAREIWARAAPGASANAEIYRAHDDMSWIFATSRLRGILDRDAISIVIATPMESMLKESRRYYFLVLGIMFFSALLVFAISLFGVQAFVLRRIQTLIEATKAIGQGQFGLQVQPSVKGGELGQLAHHIDDMADKIRRSLVREQQYRYLFERNPNPMWIFSRAEFAYLAVNEAAIKHYGYSRDEFLRMGVTDILPRNELQRAQSFVEAIRENELRTDTWRHLKKNGEEILVEVATYPIDFEDTPAIIASIKDITHETQVRARLADRDEQIRSMLESTAEAICGVDLQGHCTFANPALARLLGYDDPETLAGRNMLALMQPGSLADEGLPAEDSEIFRALQAGRRAHSEEEIFSRRDGSTFPVEYWSYPIYRDDQVSGAVITFIDITERKLQQQALEFQAQHDSLTGLPNRRMLNQRLQELCAKPGKSFHLMMIDLDRFKEVNDALGHHAGDLLLMQIASRLKQWLRRGYFLARLGGDEFAIIMPSLSRNMTAIDLAQDLVGMIEQPVEITGIRVQIGASIGITAFPEDGEQSGGLLRCADVAMYSAKRSGAMVAMYDSTSDINTAEHLALMSDLHQAIEQNQLTLHFQPKIRLRDRSIDSFEALIRWNHPQKGMIPPSQFIPLIELTSLIRPFTAWVLEHAMRTCREWRAHGLNAGVAVNVSTRNLLDMALPGQIDDLLANYALSADYLELEITESAIMSDPVRSRDVLARIRESGVHVSIDDFGTGYSSLEYLQKLPINAIKIDQTFIRQLLHQQEAISIVRAVIGLAHSLKIEVVAEGVEDEPTMEILNDLGCDIIQGYFISRPLGVEELLGWIDERIGR
ncbi:MAG TPA: EAL domain-containing protein [Methylophilaceae bacterium]|nr:EAL domain-containing protein [Methylophilaceae bacterium]